MSLCGTEHDKIINRLNRIEGQIKAIKKMVREDRDCMSVLKQIAAVNGAARSVGMVVLKNHLKGCVSEAIKDNSDDSEMIDQIIELFNRFSK